MAEAAVAKHRSRPVAGTLVALLLIVQNTPAFAQKETKPAPSEEKMEDLSQALEQSAPLPDVEDDGERVEPESLDALRAMGEAIASMGTFELKSATSVEVVLDDEQKLLIEGTADYKARRPDGLRIDMTTDVLRRELVYDGKTATFVAPGDGFYGKFDAPPTIKEMLEKAADDFDLAFPLADLFDWGTPDAPIDEILRGFRVGQAFVDGARTDHYAFREEDQDWEIWIAAEGPPLPLKYSIVDRLDPAAPRFQATLRWTRLETIPASTFEFVPPSGASEIGFMRPEIMQ